MNKIIIVCALIMLALSLVGCDNISGNTVLNCEGGVCTVTNISSGQQEDSTVENIEQVIEDISSAPDKEKEPEIESGMLTVTVNETEVVKLNPKAVDPDNDKLRYSYSSPLNYNGEWQTKIGDAGKYVVTVTVSDNELSSSQKVLIVVNSLNRLPIISGVSDITLNEGDTISLNPVVSDPEGKDVTVSYTGWMKSSTYTTTFTDAGEYSVNIIASDGQATSTKTIKIVVKDVNRAPEITGLGEINAVEGDLVKLNFKVSDPDSDKFTVEYPSPFTQQGEWQTKVGDAGLYRVKVSATDSKDTAIKEVIIKINALNRPPVIEIGNVVVNEGEKVVLAPKITDADEDNVKVAYSGWMNTSTYTTTYNDAGEYKVTITASDGKATTNKVVTVTVNNVNRPPIIIGID